MAAPKATEFALFPSLPSPVPFLPFLDNTQINMNICAVIRQASGMGNLTGEESSRLREAFCFFDKDEDGILSGKEVGIAMRSAGENASEEEVNEMVGEKGVDLKGFLRMMEERRSEKGKKGEEELTRAFRFLDRNQTGNIYIGELRHLMTTVGDKLTAEEFDGWIDQDHDCDSTGRLHLQTLVHNLLSSK